MKLNYIDKINLADIQPYTHITAHSHVRHKLVPGRKGLSAFHTLNMNYIRVFQLKDLGVIAKHTHWVESDIRFFVCVEQLLAR